MIKISVIVPTYKGNNRIRRTIRSLKKQEFQGYEIIIVDNSCDKEILKIVEEEALDLGGAERIIYVEEPQIGLHNARHKGAKKAEGEILLYIDDDVMADSRLLFEILKPYSDLSVGCVGGKILPMWEIEPPEWVKEFPKWYLSILDDEEGPKEVQWIYGCNFSIRKDLLFKLGGFNPDAFGDKRMWWMRGDGEIGLLRKVHKAGKKVIYNPDAVVWHFIPKQRLKIQYFAERAFKSGIEAGFRKYYYYDSYLKHYRIVGSFSLLLLSLLWFGLAIFKLLDKKITLRFMFIKGMLFYEWRILTDSRLREYLQVKKWL